MFGVHTFGVYMFGAYTFGVQILVFMTLMIEYHPSILIVKVGFLGHSLKASLLEDFM